MKYTIQIENVSRYIIGQVIKSFKDICPRGIKAAWIEDKSKSTDKNKTGKIEVTTPHKNLETKLYDAKSDIENKLNELVQKAEAEKQAWFEEQRKIKQAEWEKKKAEEKEQRRREAEEAKLRRGTLAEAFDLLDMSKLKQQKKGKKSPKKKSPKKNGKWPKKVVVSTPVPAVTPVNQPKGSWAQGQPTVRENEKPQQEEQQVVQQETRGYLTRAQFIPLPTLSSYGISSKLPTIYEEEEREEEWEQEGQDGQEDDWAPDFEQEEEDWAPEYEEQYEDYHEQYNQERYDSRYEEVY